MVPGNKSREKIRKIQQTSKDPRKYKKNYFKNSKKRDNQGSVRVAGMDNIFKKKEESKRMMNSTKQKMRIYKMKQSKRMEKYEVQKEVLKDHHFQKANMQKIIKNFQDPLRNDKKKKRISHSEQGAFESKFGRKERPTPESANSQYVISNEKFIHHEQVQSFNKDLNFQEDLILNTSVNNSSVIESEKFKSNNSKNKNLVNQGNQPKTKKYKSSVQKEAKGSGYSQREIMVPRDFRIFNNKVRSGEGFELPHKYNKNEQKKSTGENKPLYRVSKKGIFQKMDEKFKNMQEGIDQKNSKKMNQIMNRRTIWRERLNNPVSCIRKNQVLKYTKSKKKLHSKPVVKNLVGKFKQSFLNKDKYEMDFDRKLTRTNKKEFKHKDTIKGKMHQFQKDPSATQNKPKEQKERTLPKVKSKMKLDRMLKNRGLYQKGKAKNNLSNQFKKLKKPVGKEHFNKEKELKNDVEKYLANFNPIQSLGKGSYAKVEMFWDKGELFMSCVE
jgi:hypothetical protein